MRKLLGALLSAALVFGCCPLSLAYASPAGDDSSGGASADHPAQPKGDSPADLTPGPANDQEFAPAIDQNPEAESTELPLVNPEYELPTEDDALAADDATNEKATDEESAAVKETESLASYEDVDALALANKNILKDGLYLVSSKLYSHNVLDVCGASKASGANVQIFRSNMSSAQKWRVSHDEKGYITFLNPNSGCALAVETDKITNCINVCQKTPDESRSQKWVVTSDGSIISALDLKYCIDIEGGRIADGTNVQVYNANGTEAQKFFFASAQPNVLPTDQSVVNELGYANCFFIKPSGNTALAIDIIGASTANGANAQLYTANGTNAQMFKLLYDEGYYRIVSAQSCKTLDVDNGNIAPGTNIQQWEQHNGNWNQLFRIEKNSDGTYSFINRATGSALGFWGGPQNQANIMAAVRDTSSQSFVLQKTEYRIPEGLFTMTPASCNWKKVDVAGASTEQGSCVQVYSSNKTTAQKWKISAVPEKPNSYIIRSMCGGNCLTRDSDGFVRTRTYDGSLAQQWIPTPHLGGVAFMNAESGTMLDVQYGGTVNNNPLQTYAWNNSAGQAFFLDSTPVIENGTYLIRSATKTAQCLDVAAGSLANGANIQTYKSNDSGAQKWNITRNGDGTYWIRNAASDKVAEVDGCSPIAGSNVQQWNSWASYAQGWYAQANDDGTISFKTALGSNLYLSTAIDSPQNGTNVLLSSFNSKRCSFTLEPTVYLPSDQLQMLRRAQGYASKTSWLILIDTVQNRIGIFRGSMGNWTYSHFWECSTGAPATPTILGIYTLGSKGLSFGGPDYTCWYYSQIAGDYLIHSIICDLGTFNPQDPRLGVNISHGCVRLALENAKWVYNNVPSGTTIVTYRG